jgi:hypothetical protein
MSRRDKNLTDFDDAETKDDCTGEGQQQVNRLTNRATEFLSSILQTGRLTDLQISLNLSIIQEAPMGI